MKPYTCKIVLLATICLMMSMGEPQKVLNATPSMINFEHSYTTRGTTLKLHGWALFRYLSVIDAYSGALYLKEGTPGSNALSDEPKRLVLEYHRAFNADDLGKATRKMLEKNLSPRYFNQLGKRLDQLNALYKNVKPTDRYALTYLPGIGTELSLNGIPLGVIPGADFAKAVFSIWLGENPIDNTFRDQLLGNK